MKSSAVGRRLCVFVAGAVVSVPVAVAAGGLIIGMFGGLPPMAASAVVSGVLCVLLIALSAGLLRSQGLSIGALGLPLDAARGRTCAIGALITAALFGGVAIAQGLMADASWEFQGWPGVRAAIAAVPLVAMMVIAEELIFRGLVLRYLRSLAGDWNAMAATAVAFGVYHLAGSNHWGMGAVFQFLMPCLGGLVFAWAAMRTGGLALPIGLHLGGNWVQASVAGFALDSAPASGGTIWRIPISADALQLLTAPDLLPRLPYLAALGLTVWMTFALVINRRRVG
jgi:membrane protease YdiL (CAAX protease family)